VLHGGEGRTEIGQGRSGGSRILVIGETALALVLLICSGLLVQSLHHLLRVRLGMRTDHLLTVYTESMGPGYASPQQRIAFFEDALRRIRALPGVRAATISEGALLSGATFIEPVLRAGHAQARNFKHRTVGPGYFRTLGIPMLRGRDFDARDTRKSPLVVIVSETLARELWGTANPVGKQVVAEDKTPTRAEVVGVVADVRDNRLRPRTEAEVYTALLQTPQAGASFLVRGAGSPAVLGREIRSTLWSIDPNLLVGAPRTVRAILTERRAEPRFEAWLTTVLALVGLALGLVSVYGLFEYSVERRQREIGLRMALGAEKGDVLRLVLGEGLRVAAWGITIGLAAALAAAHLMRSLLYGVSATDPAIFAGLAAALATVSLLACYIPARRAMRVDPNVALRQE
jgi:putative ABC transport system permease protein